MAVLDADGNAVEIVKKKKVKKKAAKKFKPSSDLKKLDEDLRKKNLKKALPTNKVSASRSAPPVDKESAPVAEKKPGFFSKESFGTLEGEGMQSTVIPAIALALFGPTTGGIVAKAAGGVASDKLKADLKRKQTGAEMLGESFDIKNEKFQGPGGKVFIDRIAVGKKSLKEHRTRLGEAPSKKVKTTLADGTTGFIDAQGNTTTSIDGKQSEIVTSPSGKHQATFSEKSRKIFDKKIVAYHKDTKELQESLIGVDRTRELLSKIERNGGKVDNMNAFQNVLVALVKASGQTRISDADVRQQAKQISLIRSAIDFSIKQTGAINKQVMTDIRGTLDAYQKSASRLMGSISQKRANNISSNSKGRVSVGFALENMGSIEPRANKEVSPEKEEIRKMSPEARKKEIEELRLLSVGK